MRVEHRKYTKGYYEDGNFVEKFRQDKMIPDRSLSHLKKNESAEIYSQFEEIINLGDEKLRMVTEGNFKADYTLYGKINGDLTDEEYQYLLENSDFEKQTALMQMGGWALTSSNAVSGQLIEQHIPKIPEGMFVPTADDLRIKFKYFTLINDKGVGQLSINLSRGLMKSQIENLIARLTDYLKQNQIDEFDAEKFINSAYFRELFVEDIQSYCVFADFIQNAKQFELSTLDGSGNQPQ